MVRRTLERIDSRSEGKLPAAALNVAMMLRTPFRNCINDKFDIIIGKGGYCLKHFAVH